MPVTDRGGPLAANVAPPGAVVFPELMPERLVQERDHCCFVRLPGVQAIVKLEAAQLGQQIAGVQLFAAWTAMPEVDGERTAVRLVRLQVMVHH